MELRLSRGMPLYAYFLLAAGWVAWLAPFVLAKRSGGPARKLDKRARWGMLLQMVAYSLLWQGGFWMRSPSVWRLIPGSLFLAAASAFSWTGTRALGKQWRIDAGLNADHELVRSGPYRLVRHPIYASMLFVLLGTGFVITPWWLLAAAAIVFIAGNEIRVRVEEGLLVSNFGEEFRAYRKAVPAYLPFVR